MDESAVVRLLGIDYSYLTILQEPERRICTVSDAQDWLRCTPEHSKERKEALRVWGRLSLKCVKKAQTREELRYHYYNAPENSRAKRLAEELLDKYSFFEIKGANTLDKARTAYDNAVVGSVSERKAFKLWDEFALLEVERAKSFRYLISVFLRSPANGKAELLCMQKILAYKWKFDNFAQVSRIISTASSKRVVKIFFDAWDKFSRAEIESASTPEKLKLAFIHVRKGSPLKKRALKKWIACCTKIHQLQEVYDVHKADGEFMSLVYERRHQLSIIEIRAATTLEEYRDAYKKTMSKSKTQQLVLDAWDECALSYLDKVTTPQEYKYLFINSTFSGRARKIIIKRLLEMPSA